MVLTNNEFLVINRIRAGERNAAAAVTAVTASELPK
jgi:hypothetical protein